MYAALSRIGLSRGARRPVRPPQSKQTGTFSPEGAEVEVRHRPLTNLGGTPWVALDNSGPNKSPRLLLLPLLPLLLLLPRLHLSTLTLLSNESPATHQDP
ncbi:unnamed protein product [Lampetra planeri]